MPDPNKLQRMAEEGYRIAETCATCVRGPGVHLSRDGWGVCYGPDRTYVHAKQGEKNLPAHWALTCEAWCLGDVSVLGAYASTPWLDQTKETLHDYGYLLTLVEHLYTGMRNLREPLPLKEVARLFTRAGVIARKLIRERVEARTKGVER